MTEGTNTTDGKTTIEISEPGRAFYVGVAAASNVNDLMANEMPADATFEARLAYFWLQIGVQLNKDYPQGSDEQAQLFLHGAGLNMPERGAAVHLVIDKSALGDFEEDEDPNADAARARLLLLVSEAAKSVAHTRDDGKTEPLRHNGTVVGSLTVDLYV